MKKYILSLFAVLFLVSCGTQKVVVEKTAKNNSVEPVVTEQTDKQKTISVSSSIIPISSVINNIGGDYVDVHTIIPAGVSPHGFDLSPKDLIALEESEISFLIGLEQIDGFLEKALENKKHVELAKGIELIEVEAHDHDEHTDEEEHNEEDGHDEHSDEDNHTEEDEHSDESHDEHSVDPHVWLGKENILSIAETVRDELSLILPEQAEHFAQNTMVFQTELEAIYDMFEVQNAGKSAKEFIVFHDAYNYLMESIEIDANLKVPFSENVLHETGTAHMAEIIDEVKLHGIKHVFKEPQFTGGALQKFVDEYDLVLGILDPLGTDDSSVGYLENLKSNLDNFSKIYE